MKNQTEIKSRSEKNSMFREVDPESGNISKSNSSDVLLEIALQRRKS